MKATLFKSSRLALAAIISWASVHVAAAETVIPLQSYWQMWIGTQNASSPSTAWRAPQFNDSTWQRTLVPAGYPSPTDQTGIEAQLQTVLPPSSTPGSNYTTLFFRQSFVLTNLARLKALKLTLQVDDGAIAWLNGVEIARYNVSAVEPVYTATAFAALEVEPQEFLITAGAPYVQGTNVLAIEVFNASVTSSDMVFGATVEVIPNDAPLVVATAPPFNATVNSLGLVEVYFNEAVTNVDATDLLLNGVPATNVISYAPNDYAFYFAQPPPGTVQVSFAANHGITDRGVPPLAFAGTNWTYTIDTNVAANVVISEFLAANNGNIEDEDGDNSDWLELYNAGATTVDLAKWHLTDDRSLPDKWTFPGHINMSLGPNQYLLVWASGKDRTNDITRLHTNFRLDRAGEYLGLFDPGLEVASEFAPSYPPQFTDASYGRDRADPNLVGYYTVPTPGRQNTISGAGFSAAPVLSVASGVFAVDSITVAVTANSNAVIRYTLDGSEPTNGSPVYSSALVFNSNIVVKARAFEPGLWPSPIVARTYHFLDPSAQNFSSELPIVIVSTAGRMITENIIGGGNRTRGSLVVIDTFRGRSSIRQTPQFIGLAQFEGYGSTSAGFPKRPYRVEVNDELGNDMDVSLLGLPPEADFKLEVKMNDKTLINEFVAFELHEQMGYYAPRTKFVEVFLDAGGGKITYPQDYAGVYMVTEVIERDKFRVNIAELTPQNITEPEVTGGYIFKKDKDSTGDLNFTAPGGMGHSAQGLKIHEPKPRFITQPQLDYLINYLTAFSRSLYGSDWLERTGTNHYSNYIDVDSFVDQHWIVEYTKNIDGYRLSHFWSKDRGGKIKDFPLWDFDLVFGNADYLECGRTNGWYWNIQQEGMTSAEHVWLRRLLYGTNNIQGGVGGANAMPTAVMHSGDPVFIQKMIDRWGELRTNIFATPRVLARVDELVAFLNEAADRNYQKWPILMQRQWPNPDGNPPWNVNFASQPTYAAIIGEMKKWITGRFNWLDAQFVRAPLLNQGGGYISGPLPVTIAGPAGATIYYTIDGTDPRAPNGTVAPAAQVYASAIAIDDNARLFARARVGTNQYSWSPPTAATLIRHTPSLRIAEIMYHPAQDGLEYLAVENTGTHPLNVAGFQLSVGVDFTFPNVILQAGQRAFVVDNAAAFAAQRPGNLVLGEYSGKLDNAGERLVLTGPLREPILDFTYDDAWYPITDGLGFSLVINDAEAPTTTWDDPASWHPNADPTIPHVVINEVVRSPISGVITFIEFHNSGSEPADITGWYVTDDLSSLNHRIVGNTVIPAGGYLARTDLDYFTGNELFLLSANPDGTLSGYLHDARIGYQRPGTSSGRYINSVGQEQFVPQRSQTFGAQNAGPVIPNVVISEIIYRPSDVPANGAYWDNTEEEFVELYNRSGAPVNLAGQSLKGAGINYQFGSIVMPAVSYLLVVSFDPANAQQLAAFRAKYSVSPSVQIVGPYSGSLANNGGALDLSVAVHYNTGDFDALLERVDYDRNAPWTSLPDGAGLSLQRVLLNEYANDPANWRAASPSPGRAPGSGAAPFITGQPQSRPVVASATATATFSVSVADANVRYQWRKNTQTIAGATNVSVTVPATSTSDAANFDVIVSNDSAFTVSSNATLTVLIGITIVQQPHDIAVRTPASVRFTVLANSPSTIAYQWRFNGNPVPQANGPELFLPNPGEDNEGLYDVVMTDSVGTVISTPARLTVLAPPEMAAPVPPVNLTAVAGDRLTVSARVSGTLPIAARWRWTHGDGTTFTIADQIITERVAPFSFVVPNDTIGRVRVSLTNSIAGTLGFAVTNAIVTVLADSDGDHIPDVYERAHGMNENNPADAEADPDGDGMSNRDEYIAGTDPQDPNSYLRVELQAANVATIRFQAISNRSYTVQYTDSLNPPAWRHLEHVVARQTNYSATVTDPASVLKRFYRLTTPAVP